MAIDLNIYPYYDDAEAQWAKDYKQVLCVPGRAPQSREITQLQSFQNIQLKKNFDTLYKNGSVVDGIDLAVVGTTASITAGSYYYNGRIIEIPEQNITVLASGTENVGIYIKEEFVTEADDSTLVDPASGHTNYGLAGSHRLKITGHLVKVIDVPSVKITLPETQKYSDEDGVKTLWNLLDGIVQNYIRRPDYSKLSETLAQRTYDESGNYLVEGMKLTVEQAPVPEGEDPSIYDNPYVNVCVGPGICYVKGFDNRFIVPKKIAISRALTTIAYANEPHTYATGTDDYLLFKPYVVTDESVHLINITAIVRVSSMAVTRGTGNYDSFINIYGTTYTSINAIESIPGYTQGVDYELESDMIHWIGAKPGTGVTYYVTFTYYKNLVRDTDFTIVEDSDQSDMYNVHITNTGDIPVNTTTMLVDYYTYLARTDLFSIDKFGAVIQKEGIPTTYDKTLIPPFNEELLPLGWIKFKPGKDHTDVIIQEYNFKRTTMRDLHYMKARINQLETNIAALALEGEVKEGELSTTLSGLLVDPFNTMYKANLQNPDYYCAMNLIDQTLSMVSYERDYEYDRSNDTRTNITVYTNEIGREKVLTLEKTSDVVFFTNTLKSETMNLNPFGVITKKPFTSMSPDRDFYIDYVVTEKTIIENEVRNTITKTNWINWSKPSKSSYDDTPNAYVSEVMNQIDNKVSTEKVEIGENIDTFVRPQTITVHGKNFSPGAYVACVFGGIAAKMLAISPYRNETSGGQPTGRIAVAADGSFKATFTIPSGVRSGDIETRFIDSDDLEFIAIFKAKGIKKFIENRTVVTNVFDKITDQYNYKQPSKESAMRETPPVQGIFDTVNMNPNPPSLTPTPSTPMSWSVNKRDENGDILVDPIAQSFLFRTDKIITAFDLYFGTKADDLPKPVTEDELYNYTAFSPIEPVLIKIGLLKNGFPDAENLIHVQELYPENITTSLYGTTPTRITLTRPIFIPAMQQFYISVGSKSHEYTVFVSQLGDVDLDSGNVISENPYLDGVLFASSNGVTWNALQDKDLAIVLYEGTFATTGSFILENITFPKVADDTHYAFDCFGRFLFMNEFIETPNSGIQYYYSIDAGTTWKPFNIHEEVNLRLQGTQLQIKAELTGNGATTPIVNIETNLIFYRYDIASTNQYITKLTEDVPAYNNVKLVLDEFTESGTSIIREFCIDNNLTWFRLVNDAIDNVDIGGGFYKKTYEFDFMLLQKLDLETAGAAITFAIGDNVHNIDDSATGKIVAIDSITNSVYVLLTDDIVARFSDTDVVDNDVVSDDVGIVTDYTSEPAWPVMFTAKFVLESTLLWKSPVVMNSRWAFRAL